jgi:hypothetical protein
MLRVITILRHATPVLFCAATAVGCSSGDDSGDTTAALMPNLIQSPTLYSAFDGTNDYEITPWIPLAATSMLPAGTDSIKPETIVWSVDDKTLVSDLGEFSGVPGGHSFKTLKAGRSIIKVTATTVSGRKIRGEAPVIVAQGDVATWQKGDDRYNDMVMIDPSMLGASMADPSAGTCGLPVSLTGSIPKDAACTNCHDGNNTISVQHTPTQTEGYSPEDLIAIFTEAKKPAGAGYNSPFLKPLPVSQADCLYQGFHTWTIADDVKEGIVLKLRSIKPAPQSTVDFAALMAAAAQAQAAMGAAGAGN